MRKVKFVLGLLSVWAAMILYVYLIMRLEEAFWFAVVTGITGLGLYLMVENC